MAVLLPQSPASSSGMGSGVWGVSWTITVEAVILLPRARCGLSLGPTGLSPSVTLEAGWYLFPLTQGLTLLDVNVPHHPRTRWVGNWRVDRWARAGATALRPPPQAVYSGV